MNNLQLEPYPNKEKMCHRTGFTKSCRDLIDCKACQGRWAHVSGKDKNTGQDLDGYGCVDDVASFLHLETGHRLVGIQAAVEERGDKTQEILLNKLTQLSEQMQKMTNAVVNGILMQKQQHDEVMALTGPIKLHEDDDTQLPLLG